jgi:hypothetical protein
VAPGPLQGGTRTPSSGATTSARACCCSLTNTSGWTRRQRSKPCQWRTKVLPACRRHSHSECECSKWFRRDAAAFDGFSAAPALHPCNMLLGVLRSQRLGARSGGSVQWLGVVSSIDFSRSRSLRFAQHIAPAMRGAASFPKPDGSPWLRGELLPQASSITSTKPSVRRSSNTPPRMAAPSCRTARDRRIDAVRDRRRQAGGWLTTRRFRLSRGTGSASVIAEPPTLRAKRPRGQRERRDGDADDDGPRSIRMRRVGDQRAKHVEEDAGIGPLLQARQPGPK